MDQLVRATGWDLLFLLALGQAGKRVWRCHPQLWVMLGEIELMLAATKQAVIAEETTGKSRGV